MTIDIDTGIKILSFIFSVGAMLYAWVANRKKDTDVRFKEGSQRMDAQDVRLATLEHTVATLPGKDDIHNLQVELVRVTGTLGKMEAMMDGNAKIMARLENVVGRHEDHLIDGAKR